MKMIVGAALHVCMVTKWHEKVAPSQEIVRLITPVKKNLYTTCQFYTSVHVRIKQMRYNIIISEI